MLHYKDKRERGEFMIHNDKGGVRYLGRRFMADEENFSARGRGLPWKFMASKLGMVKAQSTCPKAISVSPACEECPTMLILRVRRSSTSPPTPRRYSEWQSNRWLRAMIDCPGAKPTQLVRRRPNHRGGIRYG